MRRSGFNRPRISAGLSRKFSRTGFTLVEILVVSAIIVVLIAMLMPALSRVHESANRTKCTSNLRTVGEACQHFAGRHGGRFPMCYRMRDTNDVAYPYYTPFCISQGANRGQPDPFSNDTDERYWTIFGTSWTEWTNCGVNLGVMTCPSSNRRAVFQDLSEEWGSVVWIDYMYVGGLTPTILHRRPDAPKDYGHFTQDHYGTSQIAITTHDDNLATKILAADTVFYSGGAGTKWESTARYIINHPRNQQIYDSTSKTWVPLPDFQNILYADGHVAPRDWEDYFEPLNTLDNYSLIQSTSSGVGGYLYLGELEAKPKPVPAPPDITPPPWGSGGSAKLPPPPPLPPPPNLPPPPPTDGPPTPPVIPEG